jgi:hypothetical protein
LILSSLEHKGCKLQFQKRLKLPNSIEWTRVPEDPSIEQIDFPNQTLIRVRGELFIEYILKGDLYEYVKYVRDNCGDNVVIYMIENLNQAVSSQNKHFQQEYRKAIIGNQVF